MNASSQLGTFLILTALSAHSAQSQAPRPAFEVASVKPSGPASDRNFEGGPGSRNPTRYIASRAMLLDLIMEAYNIEDFQISSKIPLEKEEYDVAANVPAGATKEQFRAMLQRFLEERFRLKLRMESKEFEAYALVVAKSGPKLKESASSNPFLRAMNTRDSGGYFLIRVTAQQQPLSELATLARTWTPGGEPVVDQTGLTGKYDFTLEHTSELPGFPAAGIPSAPTLFTALREQLGLELVRKKVPFHHVIVEDVDRTPSDN